MSDQSLAAETGGSLAVSKEYSERYVSEKEVMFKALPEDVRLAWERIAAHLNETFPEIEINEDEACCSPEEPWDLWASMDMAVSGDSVSIVLARFAGVDIDPVRLVHRTSEEWEEMHKARVNAEKAAKERSRQLRKKAKVKG